MILMPLKVMKMYIFPGEFPGLPPHREIEFAIDVVQGATPASITPYRMAPLELK